MKYSDIQAVVAEQSSTFRSFDLGISRELLPLLPVTTTHALVVSGIRRCGKSVLLHQFVRNEMEDVFYFNFADIRLYSFSVNDFVFLDEIVKESGKKILFFDEIQLIKGWEIYVRQKLDQSIRVIITGSNARMLSIELGTNLTGRNISKELFPFSYKEFCLLNKVDFNKESYESYLEKGGFPEFLKTNNKDVLSSLIEDIIYRDIATRYAIRDINGLKTLCIYLMSVAANRISPSKLTTLIGVKSPSTVLEYLSHFESSYVINLISKFSYSLKSQMLSEKKVYIVDNGLINVSSISASKDLGRKFENTIYWDIRKLTKNIWYFADNQSECDFVYKINETYFVLQVCYELHHDNQDREIKGLLSSMKYFNLTDGVILTLNQSDLIRIDSYNIKVIPAYQFELH
ncbi:MAG: ATP-binding protein [Bacteroidia bacterium]|nr:ATP-binding protein [Bacteroidia bacterium]